jgi:two-component system sensor histidine kinase/response regulator
MPAINPKVIADLRALEATGRPGLVRQLIDAFLAEADGHLAGLKQAWDARDARTLARLARSMKASAGNLGAQALAAFCFDVQSWGGAAEWDRAGASLSALEQEVRLVKSELGAEK